MQVTFYFHQRSYTCQIVQVHGMRELRIHSSEGWQIAVEPRQRQGVLQQMDGNLQPIDLANPYYLDLLRAAMSALELAEQQQCIAQKDQLLQEKDLLLQEKDHQVHRLYRQVALLQQQLTELSSDRQQIVTNLEQDVQRYAQAIHQQESHIQELQAHIGQQVTLIDAEDIKYRLQDQLGKKVWQRLDSQSRHDLYVAYRHYEALKSDQYTSQICDYSEAGLRLGFVVEREVVQPFFRGLYDIALEKGTTEVGGILLSPSRKYTLGMVPPLLATQWYSLRDHALKQGVLLGEAELYCTVSYNDHRVSTADRQLMRQFLKHWKHPLANWFSKGDVAAASTIDQINKLRNISAHAESFLYDWQFELLRRLIVGDESQTGILQALA